MLNSSIAIKFDVHAFALGVNTRVRIINLRRMHEGYCSRSVCVCVCVCVCVSVTMLAAAYLFYTLKTRCHYAFRGSFKI